MIKHDNYKIAENLLYSNFIRYDKLYSLTQHAFYGNIEQYKNVNVFIDMNSLLSILYRYNNTIINNYNFITESMINLAAHLRQYFLSRHNVYSFIYIVYGDNYPEFPRSILESYNQSNYSKYAVADVINDHIKRNMELLDILIPYIQDVYFIHDTEVETGVLIQSTINRVNPSPNIIISKDSYCYQLVAMNNRTFLYRPRKYFNDDNSWTVVKSNLYEAYAFQNKLSFKTKSNTVFYSDLFSFILSICGLKDRNIKGFRRLSDAITLINDCINENIINYNYSMGKEYNLSTMGIISKIESDIIERNFKALDLKYNHTLYESSKPIDIVISKSLVNLYDKQGLLEINETYFSNNPLDLSVF